MNKIAPTLALLLNLAASLTAARAGERISVVLKPIWSGTDITEVEIRETLDGITGHAGKPLLAVPQRVTTVLGQPYVASDVTASDASGAIPLTMHLPPSPVGAPVQMRTFFPDRNTSGPIALRYVAKVTPALTPRLPGPSYDLRGIEGGFGGAPFTFVLLPPNLAPGVNFELSWDFTGGPADSRGVSVLGESRISERFDHPEEISLMFILGGRVKGGPQSGTQFRAYWIGTPPFDVEAASAWSGRSFSALQRFFEDASDRPYTLLMRPYARPRDGGGATRGGFMLEYGTGHLSEIARRIMFTHEMVHHFVGSLDGDPGSSAWFGEGLAEFYKVRIPVRAGLLDLASAAQEIDVMTNAYYSSPAINMPMSEAGTARWLSSAAQAIPYNRGFVYFVIVDAAMRARSNGKRSLDDLVLAMLAERRAARPADEARWRALLSSNLGPAGIKQFEKMLQGETLVPPESAFGACFVRTMDRHPRPTLGFSEDAFLMEPRTVRALEPDSAAAKAGLKDGDEVTSFSGVTPRIAHSAPNVMLAHQVHMVVRRAGIMHDIQFSTDGPMIEEYHWVLKPHPANCGF